MPIQGESVTVRAFSDVSSIGSAFQRLKVVNVKFEDDVDESIRNRVADFSSGLCYGRGEMHKSDTGYILVPGEDMQQ
jgi:FtsZ-interacting cell division protein YlmF